MALAITMLVSYIPLVLWAYAEARSSHNTINRVRSYDDLY